MKHIVNIYRKSEYIKFSLWFLVCLSIILIPFVWLGKSLIQDGDSFNQSFPLFVYIGQWLRACLRGEIRLFDFRLGLGDDVIYALNWHGFGDITQILSGVVPYEYAEWAYASVMILKLWLCGITFLVYIKRYIHHEEYRIVGALLYAFNTYTLAWGFNCWMFLVPMMTFPLILAGVDAACKEGKSVSGALVLGLWIQSLNGFYFLYMETLLTILYFGVQEFAILRKLISGRVKRLILDGLRIFRQALLAVCLGAPLFIPSVIGYLQSSRGGSGNIFSSVSEMLMYPLENYQRMLAHLLIPNIYRNIFTLGYIVIIGILAAFTHRSKSSAGHRYLFILFAIMYCIPFWGSLMNGLSYSTDRWLFGFMFIAIVLAIMGLDAEVILSRKEKVLFYLFFCVLIISYFADSDWYWGKILPVLLYAILGFLLPYVFNKRMKYSKLIIPVSALLVIINGFLVFGAREIGGSGYVYGFKSRGVTKWEIDQKIDIIDNTGEIFKRWDVYSTSLGASLIKNFYGTTEYLSTLNGNTSEFYRELSISPGLFGATWVLKGLDGRTELEALLSVRQIMDYTGDGLECIYKYNETYLPLGVTYQSWISREQFDQLNPMEKQAALIKYVVLESGEDVTEVSVPQTHELDQNIFEANHKLTYSLTMQNIVQDGDRIYAGQDAVIRVYLNDFYDHEEALPAENELYVHLKNMRLYDEGTADLCVGNKKIQLRNAADDYYMGLDDFWINVTEWKCDQIGEYFDISLPEGKCYSLEEINLYQHETDYAEIEERKENFLQQLEIGTNRISGTADSSAPSLMMFTIPYGKGWKAYVDGLEQPVYKADVGFLAIELSEGNHTIVLEYMTPGLIAGCICAVTGIIMLLFIYFKNRRYNIKTTEP